MRPYEVGVKTALAQYQVGPSDEDEMAAHAARQRAQPHRSWLPAALAAGAAGLGGYALMRHPSSPGAGGLSAIQPAAAAHGFRRVVPVYTKADLGKAPQVNNWFSRDEVVPWLQHHIVPQVDDQTGDMSLFNRLKFWATEGEGAIPVAAHGGKQWVPNAPGGRVDLHPETVVHGRRETHELHATPYSDVVGGGQDLEGSTRVQKALTELSQGGKGVEADLLQTHAPGATPETQWGVGAYLRPGADRYQTAARLQKNVTKHFGGEHYLKPTHGLQSGGQFPTHDSDWAAQLRHYDDHLAANPVKAQWLRSHTGLEFSEDFAHYLKEHDLYEGHTISGALANPRSVVLQRKIPNYSGEYRVHAHQGQVIPTMTSSRHGDVGALEDLLPFAHQGRHRDMHAWLQGHLDSLPEDYRRGTYGFDVGVGRHPETGDTTYHILEMNPTERATATTGGGSSGFLDTAVNPTVAHAQHRAVTGRHTEPVSLATGLAGAGLAGGVARAMTAPDDDQPAGRTQ